MDPKELKLLAINYKGNKCFDCSASFKEITVYDFHHLDPKTKKFGICQGTRTRTWDEIKIELDKCVMLCANCHRIRHYTDRPIVHRKERVKRPFFNHIKVKRKIKKSSSLYKERRRSLIKRPKFIGDFSFLDDLEKSSL